MERKSVCVYSQLKSCSASEVAAMIEGVLRHCSDMEIDRHYTDTHGASIVGFAFAHMLGFSLLPRLKNVGSARLYRPATGEDHLWLNKAQTDRWRQADEGEPVPGRPESPVAPVVRQLDRTIEFLDLIGACHKFVAATGRLVPQMRGRRLSEDEREVIHKNVDRVRATCEWIVTAVDSGHLDMDEELTKPAPPACTCRS
ncbi:DUF6192 family protein [Streptomyces graminofaciens]|uniref:DUF6192 family protein n=1 Tax=Streptomyces graminofaciens TaxID=68212 RepID=UPI0025742A48|nr:DUF6192 family protein [Streptomyces graminofaciens]